MGAKQKVWVGFAAVYWPNAAGRLPARQVLRVDPVGRVGLRPSMITLDQCLGQLVTLVEVNEERPLPIARGYIDAYVPLVRTDRLKGARKLSELKGQFSRRTDGSPLRDDIVDLLDARILRLSDASDDLGV